MSPPLNFADLPKCSGHNRQGLPCGQPAMKNGKCYHHGGKSTGSPRGVRNALKHGAYSKALSPDEKARFNAMRREAGKLDAELALMRWRLEQVVSLKEKWEADHPDGQGTEVVEEVEIKRMDEEVPEAPRVTGMDAAVQGVGELTEGLDVDQVTATTAGMNPGITVIRRKPDFDGLMLKFTDSIRRAEESRQKLLQSGEFTDELERLRQLVEGDKESIEEDEE